MNKDEQLARLLRLKRHENPGTEYFEGFLDEFHAYQRKAPASQSAASLWWERAGTALSALRRPAMAWTAVGAYAAVMLLIYAWPAPDHAARTTVVISQPAAPRPVPAIPSEPGNAPAQGQTLQTSLPAAQTLPVSAGPGLTPPVPGKRRTTDQPQDLDKVIGPPPVPAVRGN